MKKKAFLFFPVSNSVFIDIYVSRAPGGSGVIVQWLKWKLFQIINQDPLDKSDTFHCNIRKNVNPKNAGRGGLHYTLHNLFSGWGEAGCNPGSPAVQLCDCNEACISENMGAMVISDSQIVRLSNVTSSQPIIVTLSGMRPQPAPSWPGVWPQPIMSSTLWQHHKIVSCVGCKLCVKSYQKFI